MTTTYTKFTSQYANPNIGISGAGLVVKQATASSLWSAAYTGDAVTTGKFYFEAVITNVGGGWNAIGFCDYAAASNTAYLGADTHACSFWPGQGQMHAGGVNENAYNPGSCSNGDTISVAVDVGAALFWVRINGGNWNGSGTANPATGAGGCPMNLSGNDPGIMPACSFQSSDTSAEFTFNFGAASFAYSVPAGFTSGWPITTYYSAFSTFNKNGVYITAGTVSNGGHTFETVSTGGLAIASGPGMATGKFYVEFTMDLVNGSGTSDWDAIGMSCVDDISFNGHNTDGSRHMGLTTQSFRWNRDGAFYYNYPNVNQNINTWGQGDVVQIAIDIGNSLFWGRVNGGNWNNSGTADPATGTGGISLTGGLYGPVFPYYGFSVAGGQCTMNCGDSTFVDKAPSGFVGFPDISSGPAPVVSGGALLIEYFCLNG